MDIEPKDYINWVSVSNKLTGKPTTIRKGNIRPKYSDKIKPLLDAIKTEIDKW